MVKKRKEERRKKEEKETRQITGHISERHAFSGGAEAGPAGGAPGAGVVTTGDNSSIGVTAPEDLPEGQVVEVEGSHTDDPVRVCALQNISVQV